MQAACLCFAVSCGNWVGRELSCLEVGSLLRLGMDAAENWDLARVTVIIPTHDSPVCLCLLKAWCLGSKIQPVMTGTSRQ